MEPETLTRAATVNSTQRSPAPYRYPLASLILTDAVLAWRNVLRLPSIIFPLHTNNPRGELYLWSSGNIVTIIVHSLLTVVGVLGFGLLGLWLQLPGFMWLLDMACYATVVWVLAWFLNMGKEGTLITSNPEIAQEVAGEKWVFVNGVMCGRWWMQSAMDELARRFGRPVDGVHNRTFGVVLDLLQCIVQRDVGITSGSVKDTYMNLRTYLLQRDPVDKKKWLYNKIVIVAHSQGALILSLALDMLFADLSDELLSRMEIYTFGNAANHFNNPPNTYIPIDGGDAIRFPTIKYIEHFANENEFVARLGVLAYHPRSAAEASTNSNGNFLEWSKSGLPHVQESAYFDTGMEDNQFAGKLFMRPGHGGHQFVMHYLDAMFKDGEEGEPVFLPVKTKEQQQREDKLSKTNDAAKISGVKTVPAKLGNVSRLWRYRGGRLIQD